MALRLVEIVLPNGDEEELTDLIKDLKILDIWHVRLSEERLMSRVLVQSEDTEKLTDALEKHFGEIEGFRVVVHSIVASLPHHEEEKKEEKKDKAEEKGRLRVNRAELYSGISDTAKLTNVYMITVALSVVVASIGLVRDNIAVIIGAMVIAPLLGPNMALSLATTLADVKLARLALRTLAVGILASVALSITFGYFSTVDPALPEIASRTYVSLGDLGLALASGAAGALFLTVGVSTALVGVMLAVALLPPLVTFGLLFGTGEWALAGDAMLLFLTNLICVNLAGVTVFVAQGVRPRTWWEADKAKRLTVTAIAIWCALLSALAILIMYFGD